MFGSSTPVTARTLAGLAARTPLLAGAAQIAYVDIDDTVKRTYGYAKQGARVADRRLTHVAQKLLDLVATRPRQRPTREPLLVRDFSSSPAQQPHWRLDGRDLDLGQAGEDPPSRPGNSSTKVQSRPGQT